jgi:hypothetical protein
MNDWFGSGANSYKTETFKKIIDNYALIGFSEHQLGIISMWTNLYMLDQMLRTQQVKTDGINEKDSEIILFEIYLSLNEVFAEGSNKLNKDLNVPAYPTMREWYPRATLATLIKYHDFTHYKAIQMLVVNYIKAVFCFRFLEEHSHKPLLDLFLNNYNMSCWQEFLDHILAMMTSVITNSDDSGLFYLNVERIANSDKKIAFLNKFALTDSNIYNETVDFLHAKANPLFKISDNRYLILDSVLAVNRIYNSMFFELKKLAENNPHLNPNYKAFFSFYTFEYIEKYLAYKLLDNIFDHTSCYNISGQAIKEKFNVESEPDYYVRDNSYVLLFEIKGSILTGNAKQSFSYPILEKEIKKKYYYDESENQDKAVKQLVYRTKLLLSGLAKYDETASAETVEIFPILLVSEIAMTTPGMNYLLNSWFREELKKDVFLVKHQLKVHDLVILDIDTLIMQFERFGKNNSLIEQSIIEYEDYTANHEIKPIPGIPYTKEFAKERADRVLESFSNFINSKFKVQTPDLFMEFGRTQIAHRKMRENL